MVSTGMKVPVAVETYRAVRNVPVIVETMEPAECWMKVPMAVETMEPAECWMKVPMAVETNGTMMKVPMTVEGMEPNEPGMKVPMAIQAMYPNKATENISMT